MSDSSTVSPDTDDLEAFETLLHGHAAEPEPAPEESLNTESEEALEEDTPPIEEPESDEPEEVDEPTPEEKPKKSRFQERIDDLTSRAKEAERREAETLRRLDEALARLDRPKEIQEPAPETSAEPTPEDTNPDGTPKYPLGEFDPAFVRALVKFSLEQKSAEFDAQRKAETERAQREADEKVIQEGWKAKTESVKERLPDFQDKIKDLAPLTTALPVEQQDFLAQTIMAMDFGPDVLYYLAGNPSEAEAIVKMPSTQQAIALGRLEARFAEPPKEKEKRLVTKAPPPPQHSTRGTAVSKTILGDEDDLDAIEKALFAAKKKRF